MIHCRSLLLRMDAMPFPLFFDHAPQITIIDPLAAFLGAPVDGRMTYRYADAVRLAGHSCPTVAGAWLMSIKAMAALWPGETPERGAVQLYLPGTQDEGVTGVIAAVAGLVTGAAGTGGFKGIAGSYGRAGLTAFATAIPATMGLRRTDSGAGLLATYRPECVPADPAMRSHLQSLLSGTGTGDDAACFARLWQERVERILIDQADDPALVTLAPF